MIVSLQRDESVRLQNKRSIGASAAPQKTSEPCFQLSGGWESLAGSCLDFALAGLETFAAGVHQEQSGVNQNLLRGLACVDRDQFEL
jgi:hypothetical protein